MNIESNMNTLLAGMQDALTDEMISRIAAVVSDSAGLLDQLNRSGMDKAIPVLVRMTENGDLERIAQMARVVSAMQDALTDEMLVRLTDVISQTLSLFERLNRMKLDNLITVLPRIMALFEYLEEHKVVENMMDSLAAARTQSATMPSPQSGLTGIWKMVREPDTQEAIRFLLLFGKQYRRSQGDDHLPHAGASKVL